MIDNNSKEFIYRHIGPFEKEQKEMLNYVGSKSLDDLIKKTVPEKNMFFGKTSTCSFGGYETFPDHSGCQAMPARGTNF